MNNEYKEKKDQKQQKRQRKTKRSNTFVKNILQVVNGDILTRSFVIKNLPFVLFIALVLVVYIGYGYHTQQVASDIRRLEKEILELNAEEVNLKSDLNHLSRQQKVADQLRERALHESHEPLKIIDVKSDED